MGCRGCEAANRGVTGVPHHERCRERIEKEIEKRDLERYDKALARIVGASIGAEEKKMDDRCEPTEDEDVEMEEEKREKGKLDAIEAKMDEYTHIIQNIVYARDPKIFDTKNGYVN